MKNESSNTNTYPKKSLNLMKQIKQIKSILINFNKTKFINKYKLNDEPVFNKLLESTNSNNLDNSDNLDNLDNSDIFDIFDICSKT